MTPCEIALNELLGGLAIRAREGVAFLDRRAPVRHLATASLRGLAGHALRRYAPEMVSRWFKPGLGGDTPPAYLFQPLHRHAEVASCFPFRIITWDPPAELIGAFHEALGAVRDEPFGETGARLVHVEWEPLQTLVFTGDIPARSSQRVLLHTPFRCRAGRSSWVTEDSLDMRVLVRAVLSRLNILSKHYGQGARLEPSPFLDLAAQVRELSRHVRLVQPHRRSSTQKINIDLSGLVGTLIYESLPAPLCNLLYTAGVFHAGKHTVEGCGHILLADADPQNDMEQDATS